MHMWYAMAVRLAAVEFSPLKTCFISLPVTWTQEFQKKQIHVFQLQWGDRGCAYVSWSGDAIMLPSNMSSSPCIHINGLYGNKLGLCNRDEILLRPLLKVVSCTRVCVEPATIDDWEILELNSRYVELNLLNQIRIVWTGQVIPVWIQKICIFIRIGATDPPASFVQLEQNTELIVNPKSHPTGTSTTVHPGHPRTLLPTSGSNNPKRYTDTSLSSGSSMGSLASSVSASYSADSSSATSPCSFSYRLSDSGCNTTTASNKPWEVEQEVLEKSIPWSYKVWYRLKSMVTSSEYNSIAGIKDSEEARLKMAAEFWKDVRIVARVQSMFEHRKSSISRVTSSSGLYTSTVNKETKSARQNQLKLGKNVTLTGPDRSLNSHSVTTDNSSSFMNSYTHLMQPTTVYLSSNCETEFVLHHNSNVDEQQCPVNKFFTFLAYLSKLPSPKEKRDEINRKFQQTQSKYDKAMREALEGKHQQANSNQSPSTRNASVASPDTSSPCVVRVIIHSNELSQHRGCQTENLYSSSAFHKRDISWYIQIPDLLRRQLGLEPSAKVMLCPVLVPPAPIQSIALYPLFDKPSSLKTEDLVFAFEHWLSCVSCMISPIPVQQHGTLLRFPISRTGDIHGEFLISVNYQEKPANASDTSQPYYLLHPLIAKRSRANILEKITSSNKPSFIHQMPIGDISELDNPLRGYRLRELGGVNDLGKNATDYLSTALMLRPMSDCLGETLPGILQGGLLICGPRGSGKSTLSRSVCREMTEWPNHVNISVVECKPLKGKRIETIRKIWEEALNEAAWRQPSVVLLDDLDHVTASPLGPEQEIGAEAVYNTRLADVLKDIITAEVKQGSRICVLATARSKGTLHQSVTSCKGCNLFQLCLEIPSLSKLQCIEVLNSAIQSKVEINLQTLNLINTDALTTRMEGYVTQDIVTVVERAIHAGCNRQLHEAMDSSTHKNGDEILLTQEDFEVALLNYVPTNLRDVPLHSVGELGWEDVGGLRDVKRTLEETLQLPAKYPSLFSKCPLRLRSGLLLYGPPGTGKTLLGGAVAKECGLNFISIKGPELLSKYIGASEQAVRDIFSRAQSAKPCILFFDEFDSLAPRRGHDSTGVTDRVVNQLLTQLDGVEGLQGVYIIGATSRPDLIDPALLRPGRMDKCLFCPIPSTEERVEILQALSRKIPLLDDVDLRSIAFMCDYFTGADFKALLYNAQLEAIHSTLSIPDELNNDSDTLMTPLISTKQRSMGADEWKLTFLDDGMMVEDSEKGTCNSSSPKKEPSATNSESSCNSQDFVQVHLQEPSGSRADRQAECRSLEGRGRSPSKKQPAGGKLQSTSRPLISELIGDSIENEEVPGPLEGLENSFSTDLRGAAEQQVIFMPTLRDGVVEPSRDTQEKINSQVAVIKENYRRRRNGHRGFCDSEHNPVDGSEAICISQANLVRATAEMKPSVSASERARYQSIYENFVQSRGGNFNTVPQHMERQRATLA